MGAKDSGEEKLSREDVLKIARLARLELTDKEVALYQQKLGRVLEHVKDLSKLKSPDEGHFNHVPKDAVAQREDKPVAFPDPKALMANAPVAAEGYFVVPAILEQG